MMGVLTDRHNTVDESSIDEHRLFDDEEHHVDRFLLPTVPENCGPQTVSLAYLLELAINHTNRDFQILSEALQKKSEVERKVAILNFATSTRVVFLKIYALVKWLKGSRRFDQLSNICFFLDQLSDFYVDTADSFVQVAREELVFARIPIFEISTAIDVLSLGTFPRLPESIKSAYISESSLSRRQKRLTTKWMNSMINYRLIQESTYIPAGFSKVQVRHGMASFTAPNEFKVYMYLEPVDTRSNNLQDDPMTKWRWRVCKVKILVSDSEIGFGSELVHSSQEGRLVEFCNHRLKHSIDNIQTVYEILHDFILKLQLDTIFCQVQYLSGTISEQYIAVEAYDAPGGLLSILYWIDDKVPSESPYRITIEYNSSRPGTGLILRHHPYNCTLPKLSPHNGSLNFKLLFNKTILFRCRERLSLVKQSMKYASSKSCCIRLIGDAAVRLNYQLLMFNDCTHEEHLNIAVNTFTGRLQCSVLALGKESVELSELALLLEPSYPKSSDKILHQLQKIQTRLLVKRYEASMSTFLFKQIEPGELPMIEKLDELPESRIFLQFIDEPQYYLIVTLEFNREADPDLHIYLVDFSLAKLTMVELNLDELIRSSAIADMDKSEVDVRLQYKTMFPQQTFIGRTKQLQIALSNVADRLLFIRIAEELRKHDIKFDQPVREPLVGGYIMRLTNISSILEKKSVVFFKKFTECSIRWSSILHLWPFECTLRDIPLVNDYKKSQADIHRAKLRTLTHVEEINPWQHQITTLSDAIYAHVVDRLKIYTNMMSAVNDFSMVYDEHFSQHCNVFLFNYHKLMLLYGKNREKICIFSWKPRMNGFLLNFAQNTYHNQERSLSSANNKWNPHAFVYDLLSNKYNKNYDLIGLVNYLVNTDRVMESILYFSNTELRSLKAYSILTNSDDRNAPLELKSNIIALSENHLRMCYGIVNINFQLLSDNQCAIQACRLKELNIQGENFEYIQLPFFTEFWNTHSSGKATYLKGSLNNGSESRPLSVPQSQMPSPQNPFGPLSCPPHVDTPFSEKQLAVATSTRDCETPACTLLPVMVVDASTFEKVMCKAECKRFFLAGKPGLFEDYLHGVNILARLGPAFDCLWRGNLSRPQIPFANYKFNSRSISFEFAGLSFSNNLAWNTAMKIYLCAYDFKLKCKLEITGASAPVESDVKIFETFFEKAVAPLGNEFAIISFLTVCRISSWPVFVAFARLMQAHMESMSHTGSMHPQITGLSNLWCVNLQLVNNKDRMQNGILLNDKILIFTLNLHSLRTRQGEQTKRITLHYNIETNQIASKQYHQQMEIDRQDHASIECLLQDASMSVHNECAIWPCVRKILENFRSVRHPV